MRPETLFLLTSLWNTPGCFLSCFGQEDNSDTFHGSVIFQDAATGIIWIECQVSLDANETITIMTKIQLEEWLWEMAAVELSHAHSEN